jgi:hypothetical protein
LIQPPIAIFASRKKPVSGPVSKSPQIRFILENGQNKTDPIMHFVWPITGGIAIWTIRKTEAARTRIWGCQRHYMGLNLGFVLGINGL